MMRKATWEQLNRHGLVKLIGLVCKALGIRLVKKRLAQAVPVGGILLNGGMSAQMADSTFSSARDVYRLRHLTDKYGIAPASWVTESAPAEVDDVLGAALDVLDDDLDVGA